MILPLALALTLSSARVHSAGVRQEESSVFAKLFPHATGQNAFEDYVRAGSILDDPSFLVFQYWLPPDKRPTAEQMRQADDARRKLLASMTPEERKGAEEYSDHLSPEDQELAERLNGMSYLQTRQEEIQRYRRALDLLAQGNHKPFEYAFAPRESIENQDAVVGKLARQLVRLASDDAFVDYSAGDSTRGTQMLTQTLVMAHRLGSSDIPCRIASTGLISVILGRFGEHLGAISLPDSEILAKLARSLLDDRADFATMIKNDRERMSGAIDDGFKSGSTEGASLGQGLPVARQVETLTAEQKSTFLERLHQLVNDRYSSLAQRFDSPEENWLTAREPEPTEPPDPKNLDELARVLSRAFTSEMDHEVMLSIMKSRTQLRLLQLHARIIEFRWESGRFPNTLDELKRPHDEIYDPLSHSLFNYAVSNNAYKLSSAGIPETGEIELRYRAPSELSPHDPDRP
jgi:hypothetical protein